MSVSAVMGLISVSAVMEFVMSVSLSDNAAMPFSLSNPFSGTYSSNDC